MARPEWACIGLANVFKGSVFRRSKGCAKSEDRYLAGHLCRAVGVAEIEQGRDVMRNCWATFIPFALAITSLGISTNAIGAEIGKANDPLCLMELHGEIVKGDLQQFNTLADEILPGSDGETTWKNTICLNSPGGNLAEGTALAGEIYKRGITTIIRDGEACYSACAIMFMMGVAQGGEMGWASRKMHKNAQLGFHRPYLDIDSDEKVSIKALAVGFDEAQNALLQIFNLANSPTGPFTTRPMMKPDLVQAMISHVGNDFFMVDDVNRAGRFDIEIFGFQEPTDIDAQTAFIACDNAFYWETRLMEPGSVDYLHKAYTDKDAVERQSKPVNSSYGKNYHVVSNDAGYADAECNVRLYKDKLNVCGTNNTYDTQLGSGVCDPSLEYGVLNSVSKIALWPAYSKLANLPSKIDATNALKGPRYRCVVKAEDNQTVDEEICVQGPGSTANGFLNIDFVWPSGSKTVISIGKTALKINGDPAQRKYEPNNTTCFQNERTRKWFCATKLTTTEKDG